MVFEVSLMSSMWSKVLNVKIPIPVLGKRRISHSIPELLPRMSLWTALDVTCHQDGRLQTLLLSWCLIFVIATFSTLAFVSPHLRTWYIFHWDITEKENYWDNEPEELIISYNKTPFFLLLFGEYVWAVGNEATSMKGFLITHILDWR